MAPRWSHSTCAHPSSPRRVVRQLDEREVNSISASVRLHGIAFTADGTATHILAVSAVVYQGFAFACIVNDIACTTRSCVMPSSPCFPR